MANKYKIVVCEGQTDRYFIGKYLTNKYGLVYVDEKDDIKTSLSFRIKYKNDFYQKDDENIFVVEAGSNTNFPKCLKHIKGLLNDIDYLDDVSITKIAIITDHDDDHAIGFRQNVEEVFLGIKPKAGNLEIGKTYYAQRINKNGEMVAYDLLYMLVPEVEEGALETFLVDVMENDDNRFIIEELEKFLNDSDHDKRKYLCKRGHRTKAKLTMLLAAMFPERNSIPYKYWSDIDWTAKEEFNRFFDRLGAMLMADDSANIQV